MHTKNSLQYRKIHVFMENYKVSNTSCAFQTHREAE